MSIPLEAHLAAISDGILVVVGLYVYKYLPKEMRILLFFFSTAVLINLISLYLALHYINNLWLFHIYTLLEYSLLMVVFSYWHKIIIIKKSLRVSILIFIIIWIIAKLILEDFNSFDNFTSSLISALLTIIAIYTLVRLAKDYPADIFKRPQFWVSTAVLIYYTGNIFTFALSSTVIIWSIHNLLYITANICYAGGFLSLRH